MLIIFLYVYANPIYINYMRSFKINNFEIGSAI